VIEDVFKVVELGGLELKLDELCLYKVKGVGVGCSTKVWADATQWSAYRGRLVPARILLVSYPKF